MLLTGRVVTPTGVIQDGAVTVDGDRLGWVGPRRDLPRELVRSTPNRWGSGLTILPGLVDVHCHGGGGGEVGLDVEQSRTAAAHHLRHGTTSLVGSLVSAAPRQLVAGVLTCASLVADGVLAGIHLEGPFLSVARCGAQDPTALTDSDPALVEALVGATAEAGAPEAIVQMTYAPERPGGGELPSLLAEHGIIASLGHTDADAVTAWDALRRVRDLAPRGGLPLVTHVFNGMPPLHHRSPGPAAAALAQAAQGEAVVEVVADGVHLAAATVRMIFDLVGPDQVSVITDSMAASGMPDGRYTVGGQQVVVADRTARLARGGAIAGGVATLLDVVRWCVVEVGLPLQDAVTAASRTPARTLGLDDVGELVAGRRADVLLVDATLQPVAVMRSGSWLS